MKTITRKLTALILCLVLLASCAAGAFAQSGLFTEQAYTTVVTVSDLQSFGPGAFGRFARTLTYMKNNGLTEPDAVLSGGDYSRFMYDYATLGIIQLREKYLSVYPQGDADRVICIQGNHDLAVAGFYPSGLYDMGTYCLYLLNEDDFPWKQGSGSGKEGIVKSTAAAMKSALDGMINSGDTRPVIILTHVPLHFTSRNSYGDNLYASYLFDVINEAARKLDIIYLFGHNHSGNYDDYIGGSVNYIPAGGTILIPDPANRGEKGYTQRTAGFTYTNCGYIGYAENGTGNGSVNLLTLGAISLFEDKIEVLRFTEDSLLSREVIERKNTASAADTAKQPTVANLRHSDEAKWQREKSFLEPLIRLYLKIFSK